MSLFLVTTKNELPERFRSEIDVANKSAIAEKLISESFLNFDNFESALQAFQSVNKVAKYRTVDGYSVTNITCVPTEEDANNLKNIYTAQREKNATQIDRDWTHPENPNDILITSITENDWAAYEANLVENHVQITYNNLRFI